MSENHMHGMETESSAKEYVKFLAVLVGITAIATVLNAVIGSGGFQGWMRMFMGVFFLVFALFKFIGYGMFTDMYAGYDIVAKRFKAYAYAYPFIELSLGLLYLTNTFGVGRDTFTVVIMFISSIGVFQEIKKRSGIHCACLGNIIKLPLSTTSLVEDVAMGLMALAMLVMGL
jgi:hypothetical protein